MSKDSNSTLKILILVIIIGIIVAYFLTKWAIIAVGFAFIILLLIIANSVNTTNDTKIIQEIIQDSYKNVKLKISKNISKKEIISTLGLFDKSIYNNLFENKIIQRGEVYFLENKIQNLKKEEDNYSCIVKGSKDYNVYIKLDGDNIIESNCNCPYCVDEHKKCKHIYALLYKIKCENNNYILKNEINNIVCAIGKMAEKSNRYIQNHFNELNSDIATKTSNKLDYIINRFEKIQQNLTNKNLEEDLIRIIKGLIEVSIDYKDTITTIIKSKNSNIKTYVKNIQKGKQANLINSDDESIIYNVAFEYETKKNKKSDDRELKDLYGLDEAEIKHVKEDGYDPWNFEEEELEEDDFYSEDD